MNNKYAHQIITGISFGLTSGVITALGMMVGLYSATSSKSAVVAGIVVMAIADGLADAAGMHMAEEAEVERGKVKHTSSEIWLTTSFTFLSVASFILTFVFLVLVLPMRAAIFAAVGWGILLLIFLNFYIAKIKKENPAVLISEHVFLALFVVFISYWAGILIARLIE